MRLEHIELKELKTSPVNVRKTGVRDVSDLIPSIRSIGVIQPLLVHPNGEGYEVVAGGRRLRAAQAIAQEAGGIEPLPCAVLEAEDDAAAIEASLAENIARLPMDEIDQYEAFAAFKAKGRTVTAIADSFGVTERLVKQRLAIAGLLPAILNAYRAGRIDGASLRTLTMATKAQQKAWLKRFRDPEDEEPTGRWLKMWLFGGAEIPLSSALFPLEAYDGHIVSDLFGEERYFDDPEKFWKLQLEAVFQRQAAYLEEGWSNVVVMQTGERFYSYDKTGRGRHEGGWVYIACADNGEIGFHEGWLPEKEARRLDRAAAKAEGKLDGKAGADPKPELTKAAIRYCELHRHNAVRMELLKAPDTALRVIAAHMIAGSGLWDVRPESQDAARNDTSSTNFRPLPMSIGKRS